MTAVIVSTAPTLLPQRGPRISSLTLPGKCHSEDCDPPRIVAPEVPHGTCTLRIQRNSCFQQYNWLEPNPHPGA